jgi:hypothetical protein
VVVNEEFAGFLLAELFQWICPENVAHKPVGRRLTEAIDLRGVSIFPVMLPVVTYALEIIQCMQLGAQTAMNAKELLVHNGSERQRAK